MKAFYSIVLTNILKRNQNSCVQHKYISFEVETERSCPDFGTQIGNDVNPLFLEFASIISMLTA